ncbi:MAG TPA: VOC family protein [Dehalococcoidia bacterium]|nr:VOC family protein [Dehalococcoidia bacterium]
MDKVVHFEIPADDVERAKKFYSSCFGWRTQSIPEMDYTLVMTVAVDEKTQMPKEPGAINGGMFQRQPDMPHPQIFINVSDMDEALEKVRAQGGEIVRGKTPVGPMGFVANFKDTEGNVVGLWQDAQHS